MHEYRMPMRWADLDSLNHVNNVVYLDYAAEARASLVDDGVLDADHRIRRADVEFLRPLLLSSKPVVISSWLDGDRLVQEIAPASTGDPVVFARVISTLGDPGEIDRPEGHGVTYPLRVRRGDLGSEGTASGAKVFEYFQEGRIALFSEAFDHNVAGRFVVARTDVEYARPLSWSAEPYVVETYVSRIGTASVTMMAILRDDTTVYARATAVLVGFDLATQRSRPFDESEREHFRDLTA